MLRRFWSWGWICSFIVCVAAAPWPMMRERQTTGQTISFSREVLPIFNENCFRCHGLQKQTSNLDLRTRAGLLKGGQHGPAIVPGDADASRLYRRVAGLEKPSMPLDGELDASEIEILRRWINQRAPWDGEQLEATTAVPASPTGTVHGMEITPQVRQFWAFRKPVRAVVPQVKNAGWSLHPIDAFLMRAMEEKRLAPAPRADRYTLVRRAYLDLIGLPPSRDEVKAFVNDAAPDAWENLIDRLLASPHYGERWGRHWLDVARYADSSGFEEDIDRPTAWRYRDYVIRSFNMDKPYNLFIAEQLAGDELDWVSFDSKIATGFLRAGPRVMDREKDNPEYRFNYLDDMIATTAQGILGLSVQCARCHDHKFDPIPQMDYYRLQAVFFPYVDVDHYLAPQQEVKSYLARKELIEGQIKSLREQISSIEAPYRDKFFIDKVLNRFPKDAQIAVKTPEEQRTPGQKLHATILHLLGMDHTRLTYFFNGWNMRLTDVEGNLIPQIVA